MYVRVYMNVCAKGQKSEQTALVKARTKIAIPIMIIILMITPTSSIKKRKSDAQGAAAQEKLGAVLATEGAVDTNTVLYQTIAGAVPLQHKLGTHVQNVMGAAVWNVRTAGVEGIHSNVYGNSL